VEQNTFLVPWPTNVLSKSKTITCILQEVFFCNMASPAERFHVYNLDKFSQYTKTIRRFAMTFSQEDRKATLAEPLPWILTVSYLVLLYFFLAPLSLILFLPCFTSTLYLFYTLQKFTYPHTLHKNDLDVISSLSISKTQTHVIRKKSLFEEWLFSEHEYENGKSLIRFLFVSCSCTSPSLTS
jgi:hypothetical protein